TIGVMDVGAGGISSSNNVAAFVQQQVSAFIAACGPHFRLNRMDIFYKPDLGAPAIHALSSGSIASADPLHWIEQALDAFPHGVLDVSVWLDVLVTVRSLSGAVGDIWLDSAGRVSFAAKVSWPMNHLHVEKGIERTKQTSAQWKASLTLKVAS